jgi:uncharacterized protein with HEPN domain
LSLEQYLADEKTRAAVERVLEVCGEAMSNLYCIAIVHAPELLLAAQEALKNFPAPP